MYADRHLEPWLARLRVDVPGLEPFDVHTHIGANDPDGFRCSAGELTEALEFADSRAAVFPMHEPDGYRQANDEVLSVAGASEGRMVAFCRVDPASDPVRELERCLAAGAKGLKLHPRAERFTMAEPSVSELFALAHERRLPIVIHAGRGIPALGRDVLELAERFPGARVILAHMGVCDLAWLWRHAAATPNLFFDTSFWSASDALALFGLVAPGQILYGSDVPFGAPVQSLLLTSRCALQAGLGTQELHAVLGGQLERLLSNEDPIDLGPAPGPAGRAPDLLLGRIHTYLMAAFGALFSGGSGEEHLGLARLAAEGGDEAPAGLASISALIDTASRGLRDGDLPGGRIAACHLVLTADLISQTPDVPVPELGLARAGR